MTKRKIALVGIGKIARDQHIPAINASEDWELAATVSRHGSVDGIDGYEDLGAMLQARPDIEVVSLCMPPGPRFGYAEAALMAGRHVMLEKPPGATLAECDALKEMAREEGVALFASWHSREADKVDAARDWLKGKHVRRLDVTWKEDVRRWHPGQEWIFEPGGLGVFDPGINALSILTKILPEPMHLIAAVLETPENRQTPIASALTFAYPGAETARAVFDWRQEGDQTWTISVGTDAGTLTLHDGGARLFIGEVEEAKADDAALAGEYPRLYAHLARLVGLRQIDMDLTPMIHVADAFTLGERKTVAPFHW